MEGIHHDDEFEDVRNVTLTTYDSRETLMLKS